MGSFVNIEKLTYSRLLFWSIAIRFIYNDAHAEIRRAFELEIRTWNFEL